MSATTDGHRVEGVEIRAVDQNRVGGTGTEHAAAWIADHSVGRVVGVDCTSKKPPLAVPPTVLTETASSVAPKGTVAEIWLAATTVGGKGVQSSAP